MFPTAYPPISEVKPIEVPMEFLFDVLSTLKFRPRLFNVGIVRESFQQNKRLLVGHHLLFFTSDREHRGQRIQFRRPRLHAHRDFHQFRCRIPQSLEILRFRVRINNRLCGKFDQRRTALDRQNLLLDRSRETPGRTYERVQRFPGECRRDQAERNDYPKHEAIISDAVARRQLRFEVAEVCPICSEEAILGGLDWT